MKNNKILLLVKFEPSGGTKTGFENLMIFYEQEKYNISLVYYKENDNFDYSSYFKKYKYPLKLISKNKSFLNYSPLLNIFINQILNFVKVFFIIMRQRPSLFVVSDWDVANFSSLLVLPIKTINIVNSYPLKKINLLNNYIRLVVKNNLFITVSDYAKNQIIDCWLGLNFIKTLKRFIIMCLARKLAWPENLMNH